MAIPSNKLETWSGSVMYEMYKTTHQAVRNALDESKDLKEPSYTVYLQGSYANDTNIRGSSDVDIVVELLSTYSYDISNLSPQEQQEFHSGTITAKYTLQEFKTNVINALTKYFNESKIEVGNKCIKIEGKSNRSPADVLVCNSFRKYKSYSPSKTDDYIEGIRFFSGYGNEIINYPKLHITNGQYKNKEKTNGLYKPSVRMFKNARDYLYEKGIVNRYINAIPSYYLECLAYNVPNSQYSNDFQTTYCNVVNWLNKCDLSSLICQNEQQLLFGDSLTQWKQDYAKSFLDALVKLWNKWDEI